MSWHKGDHGKPLLMQYVDEDGNGLNISDTIVREVEVQAPRRPWVTLATADLTVTDAGTGTVSYDVPDGDFFWAAGKYWVRGYVESPTIGNLHMNIASFIVEP